MVATKPVLRAALIFLPLLLLLWLVPPGYAQDLYPDFTLESIFGIRYYSLDDADVRQNDVVGGGPNNLAELDWATMRVTGACAGYTTAEPTLAIQWRGEVEVRLFFVAYAPLDDATLLVYDRETHRYFCNDNGDQSNPVIDLPARAGERNWYIWVGNTSPYVPTSGVFYVFEDRNHTPSACLTETDACGSRPDAPAWGEIGSDSVQLSGEWEGLLFQQPGGGTHTSYYYSMTLQQSRYAVAGSSWIQIPDQPDEYGEMLLYGITYGDRLVFWETEVTGQGYLPDFRWCIKQGRLAYFGDLLTGAWSAPDCSPGEILLIRIEAASSLALGYSDLTGN